MLSKHNIDESDSVQEKQNSQHLQRKSAVGRCRLVKNVPLWLPTLTRCASTRCKEGHKRPRQSKSATKWSVLTTAHCGSSDQEANFYMLAVSFVHKKLLTSSVLANESGEISEDSFFFIQ